MGNGFTEDSVAATVEHYTPSEIFDALGEQFDLDPCHPSASPLWLPIRRVIKWFLTKEMDGLATPWPVGCYVFMNPPYGRECALWLAKMAAHGNGIALVFARTGTRWFQDTVAPTADAICFVKSRVRFIDQKGVQQDAAKADSILVAWGSRAVEALRRSGLGTMMYFDRSLPVTTRSTVGIMDLALHSTVPLWTDPSQFLALKDGVLTRGGVPVQDPTAPLVCKCGAVVTEDFTMVCNACMKMVAA